MSDIKVKNLSARPYTIDGKLIAPLATETVGGEWAKALEGNTEVEVIAEPKVKADK